ncbi:hypothetical protein WICPIJ_007236 [Wickerhamomyces pijperi]|uniref:Uncharacterized protein n=1 Tax=Wickerhamomyces pijperi TaxID=599730 RepID=A0A9P8Q068_WICPI|nr:hypothetical protein WICPIJ_007236 [Wickerhamomyces pijperi]
MQFRNLLLAFASTAVAQQVSNSTGGAAASNGTAPAGGAAAGNGTAPAGGAAAGNGTSGGAIAPEYEGVAASFKVGGSTAAILAAAGLFLF